MSQHTFSDCLLDIIVESHVSDHECNRLKIFSFVFQCAILVAAKCNIAINAELQKAQTIHTIFHTAYTDTNPSTNALNAWIANNF